LRAFHESNDQSLQHCSFYESNNRTLADAYFRLTLYRRAEKHYLLAHAENSDDFGMQNLLGLMWNKLQNYKKAIEYVPPIAQASQANSWVRSTYHA
jgi:hypothetical protein